MKKKYRLLCLTDHSGHSADNSLYGLLNALCLYEQCGGIDVLSRGNPLNAPFFSGQDAKTGYVTSVLPGFSFGDLQCQAYSRRVNPLDYDVLVLRLPWPIGKGFFPFLESAFEGKVMVNSASGIAHTSNKGYLLRFRELCPPMKMCCNWGEIQEFLAHFPIVLKPLHSYGGKGLVKIDGEQVWMEDREMSLAAYKNHYQKNPQDFLAMQYMERVGEGDKRILVSGGSILGASLRRPSPGSWLCNVSHGGSSEFAEVADEEKHIAEILAKALLANGIVYFGFDTLLGNNGERVLSEINTLSVGGLIQAPPVKGCKVVEIIAQGIWEYIEKHA